MPKATEPLASVWRTRDRLHTDEATVEMLVALAARDDAIGNVVTNLEAVAPGNGSVWASGRTRRGGRPALLKMGAGASERDWMTAIDRTKADIVPSVFGSGELRGVGWLVLERCTAKFDRGSPTDAAAVLRAAARWQDAGAAIGAVAPVMDPAWLHDMLEAAASLACPGDIAGVIGGVERNWDLVVDECGLTPNHGDVHTGNAVARHATGPALLIDPMPITSVWAWDAAYLQAVLMPYQAFEPEDGLIPALARERRALGLPAGEGRLDRVERVVLAWAAAALWRMAPWRHDKPQWCDRVERCVTT